MVNKVQEYKTIVLQAILFVSLMLVLNFILEGRDVNNKNIDKVDVENFDVNHEMVQQYLWTPLS